MATYLPSFKTIQERQKTRHGGHCWRSKDELSDVLQWTSSYGCASVGRTAKIFLHQLCVDLGCSLENLPGVMDDRD